MTLTATTAIWPMKLLEACVRGALQVRLLTRPSPNVPQPPFDVTGLKTHIRVTVSPCLPEAFDCGVDGLSLFGTAEVLCPPLAP